MSLAQPTRHRLGWVLGVAFATVAVVPISLFYGLDFRLDHYGRHPIYTCSYARSDLGETSDLWWRLAFYVGPLAAGVLAYVGVAIFAPGRLGRTGWRFAFGLPIAALVTAGVFFAALSGVLIYSECPD